MPVPSAVACQGPSLGLRERPWAWGWCHVCVFGGGGERLPAAPERGGLRLIQTFHSPPQFTNLSREITAKERRQTPGRKRVSRAAGTEGRVSAVDGAPGVPWAGGTEQVRLEKPRKGCAGPCAAPTLGARGSRAELGAGREVSNGSGGLSESWGPVSGDQGFLRAGLAGVGLTVQRARSRGPL